MLAVFIANRDVLEQHQVSTAPIVPFTRPFRHPCSHFIALSAFFLRVLVQNIKLAPGTSSANHCYCLCLHFLQRNFNLQLPTEHFLARTLYKSLRNPTAPTAMLYTSSPALVRIFLHPVNDSKTSSKMMLHLLFPHITALFFPLLQSRW